MTDAHANPEGLSIEVVDSGRLSLTGETLTVRIGSHLWPRWTRIAISHENAAVQARARALGLGANRGSDFSAALSDELDASMQAISASAHAIDTFYGAIKQHIKVPEQMWDAWQKNQTVRRKRVLETIKLGCNVGAAATKQWAIDLRWLFDLRNDALHYEEEIKDTAAHPLGIHMAPEHISYSIETVDRALNLVLGVMAACVASPRLSNQELSSYLSSMSSELQTLLDIRASLAK